MFAARNDFSTGCNSSSVTAKSPSTIALSSAPANAAQVLTPISFPISIPFICDFLPIVNFTIPSFTSPCRAKISFRGAGVIELLSGNDFFSFSL